MDLKGAPGMRPPPGSKFFHFHAVFGQKNRLAHPLWELAPSLRKILDPPLETNDKVMAKIVLMMGDGMHRTFLSVLGGNVYP